MGTNANERIEKLIYESGLIAQGCWDKFDEYDKESLNKFAELIVQEFAYDCMDVTGDTERIKFVAKKWNVEL